MAITKIECRVVRYRISSYIYRDQDNRLIFYQEPNSTGVSVDMDFVLNHEDFTPATLKQNKQRVVDYVVVPYKIGCRLHSGVSQTIVMEIKR